MARGRDLIPAEQSKPGLTEDRLTPAEAARAARSPVVVLLAAVLFLNYVDRGALPTALHHIQADLRLTDIQLGMLGSAFFWTYALAQVPIGWRMLVTSHACCA